MRFVKCCGTCKRKHGISPDDDGCEVCIKDEVILVYNYHPACESFEPADFITDNNNEVV